MNIKKILVAYDFSQTAKGALETGCALAALFSARLEVLYVVSSALPQLPNFNEVVVSVGVKLEETVAAAARKVTKTAKKAGFHWESLLQEGNPYKVITKRAEETEADLVIVGTHGYKRWERIFLGSVAEKIVRHAPCPVLIHRTRPNKAFKKILVSIDLSKVSMNNLKVGVAWANNLAAKVTVVHAIDLTSYIPISDFNLGLSYKDLAKLQESEEKRFASFVAAAAKNIAGLRQIKWQLLNGQPVRTIVEYAKKQRQDLIIMAAHGGEIGRFFLGSTVDSVCCYAPCSVLILKEKPYDK